jgi:succinoglycan biosynthesis protein ExoA
MVSPQISIIMPVRDEAAFIERSLGSVLAQDFPPELMEILVIDGMSDDGTRAIVERLFERETSVFTRILENPQRVVPTALNIGIAVARGRLVVRLDAHSDYPPDYVRLCVETADSSGADNVGGIVVPELEGSSRAAQLVKALTTHRFGVGDSAFRVGTDSGAADTVPFGCFRREVFERIGLYDERLVRNQDYELNRRLAHAGGRVWLDTSIRAYYSNRRTLSGLFQQAFANGQWNPWMWYVAPYSLAARHAIPSVFVLAVLTSLLLATMTSWGSWALAAVLAPYLLLAAASGMQQALRYGKWMAPLLPWLFAAYHISYGTGTLYGIALLALRRSPVQRVKEPWPGAGRYRAWPLDVRSSR